MPLGFDHAPGGAANAGIAFHSYIGQNLGTWPVPGLKAYYQTRIRDARNLSTGLLMTESGSFFLQQRVRPELEKLGPPHDQPLRLFGCASVLIRNVESLSGFVTRARANQT